MPRLIARWLLLACTVVGLSAMHTLGHAGTHRAHGEHPLPADRMASAAVAMTGTSLTTVLAGTAAAVAADCGCAHVRPSAPGHGGLPTWSVCLAILGGLAVVVLAALRLMRSRRYAEPGGMAAALPLVPRGPPRRRTGLILATVSVLRT